MKADPVNDTIDQQWSNKRIKSQCNVRTKQAENEKNDGMSIVYTLATQRQPTDAKDVEVNPQSAHDTTHKAPNERSFLGPGGNAGARTTTAAFEQGAKQVGSAVRQ